MPPRAIDARDGGGRCYPYDTEELAGSIHHALEMAPGERLERMRNMRAVVRERNIYRWAANLIGELCAVRTEAEPPGVRAPVEVG